jgi:PAS domain S-box-containing protein
MTSFAFTHLPQRLRQWMLPPVFVDDSEKSSRANLIDEVIRLSLLFDVIIIFGALIGHNISVRALTVACIWLFTLLLGRYLLHQGFIRLSLAILIAVFFMLINASIVSLGTIRTPATSILVFWVMVIGMLFQLRGIVLATVASSLAVLGLIYAENALWLPKPDYSVGLTQWIVFTAVMGMTAGMSFLTNRRNLQLLAHANAELLQRRRTEALLRSVIDHMTDPVLLKDEKCRFTLANLALAKLYDVEVDALIGKTDADFGVPADLAEVFDESIRAVFQTGQTQIMHEDSRDANSGEIRHYRSVKTPIVDSQGQRQVLVVAQDITEQKRLDGELRQTVDTLHLQEHNLRNIIDNMPAVISYWDKNQVNIFGNLAYSQWFGIDSSRIPGMHLQGVLGEALYQQNLPHIKAVLDGHYQRFERTLLMPDGKSTRQALHDYVPNVVDGEVNGFYAMVFDVSDLHQARMAAQAATLAKSQFLATMSHEIRTPMNGILGMAQMLVKADGAPEDRRQYAQTILQSGRSLQLLLDDILDFSKVEAGRLTLETIPFDVRSLVADVQCLFVQTAAAKGLLLQSHWRGETEGKFLGDPSRLRQMLSNLVSNGIKFTASGSVEVEVRELDRQGQRVVLEFSVVDSGVGVPRDQQSLLFQPFSQADSSTTRHFGGTGLGLSIVRNLAELMNGEVGLVSEPGQGARFWFRVQLSLDTAPLASAELATVVPIAQAKRHAKILVVEDNPVNRMVIGALLDSQENFELTQEMVENGQLACDFFRRGGKVDLVLMDAQMPVMDGMAATMEIRRWEAEHGLAPVPIVALTANAYQEDRQNCFAAGMNDFLAKPLDMKKLEAILHHWLPL